MSNPAASERRRKEAQPEKFCPNSRCLWRKASGPCPRHQSEARNQLSQDAREGYGLPTKPMWKRMELSLDAAKYLRGTHTAWSCVRDGVYIVTVLPNGTEPSANDGGYYNLTTALTMKGMKP